MVAKSHIGLLLPPMNVYSSSKLNDIEVPQCAG